jgi:hypothetical protein
MRMDGYPYGPSRKLLSEARLGFPELRNFHAVSEHEDVDVYRY